MHELKIPLSEIDLDQFKSLLEDLENSKKEILIRLQINGEPWMENFSNVLVFSNHATILTHIPTRTIKHIPDLKQVMGFEIDRPYMLLRPFRRYVVFESLKIVNDGIRHA